MTGNRCNMSNASGRSTLSFHSVPAEYGGDPLAGTDVQSPSGQDIPEADLVTLFLDSYQPEDIVLPFGSVIDPLDMSGIADFSHDETALTGGQPQSSRGLPRRRSKYFIPRSGRHITTAYTAPNILSPDPLTRWQQSPPEDEPASLSAVRNAVQGSFHNQFGGVGPIDFDNQCIVADSDVLDAFRTYRRPRSQAASTTSGESIISASSHQSYDSGLSNGAIKKKSRSRPRRMQSNDRKDRSSATSTRRPFCCTFCCDTFKTKYDWMRHEKSLHLNLEYWVCAPFGGTVVMKSTGRTHCAYCSMLDPTPDHLAEHNHGACDGQQRQFRRKDHLVQHLRFVHRLTTVPIIADWKIKVDNFVSRCGFCDQHMNSWSERCDHLALHFRNGYTMAAWKGDHMLPDWIASQVTRAVPPYLIDLESHTMVPFSATNRQVDDHFSQMLSRATLSNGAEAGNDDVSHQGLADSPGLLNHNQGPSFDSYLQILTLHLRHYAEEQLELGTIPTDEMFQREARRLLFDSDDPWNQTIADQPEWLAAFREEHIDCRHGPSTV
ncbi:hypothetical protein BO78DRAFT_75497 [Aspergillus sclerotiicarbonarius CBS 121057]|uniref:C2H2-type domain-containing protein n=1 Tax=Aspergillus sclerotiicarbonarius (strain CBS 121057 / IBT 28362) TaxID=1448318 RepID=A0A319ENK3_ASPSB|nr:hypothetical protein BO78DRAFT_75497 [Aspergillus sclerotiicarbonarius CBS 121057]